MTRDVCFVLQWRCILLTCLSVQGYMVLLWVYRAAEIKKNLLSKITADSLPHQVLEGGRSVCY